MLALFWITVHCFRNHKDVSQINFKFYKYITKRYNYVKIVIVEPSNSNYDHMHG